MKPLAAALLVIALAGCGDGRPMSQEDKALAVMLFARPAYTPPAIETYRPYMIPTNNGHAFSCSTIGGITNCY